MGNAVYFNPTFHFTIGGGNDIKLFAAGDKTLSASNFGHTYKLSADIGAHGSNEAKSYLAGKHEFNVLEIEVYKI